MLARSRSVPGRTDLTLVFGRRLSPYFVAHSVFVRAVNHPAGSQSPAAGLFVRRHQLTFGLGSCSRFVSCQVLVCCRFCRPIFCPVRQGFSLPAQARWVKSSLAAELILVPREQALPDFPGTISTPIRAPAFPFSQAALVRTLVPSLFFCCRSFSFPVLLRC
jgi:hypothetical protein